MTARAHLDQQLVDPSNLTVGLGRQRAVVFCGDLNDEPAAATTQIVAGPTGSDIDPRAGSAFQRPDADDAFRLWNLAPLLPTDQRFTRVFKGRGELIDHIFATHRLVNPGNLPTVQTIRSVDPCRRSATIPPAAATSLAPTTPPWSPPSTSDLDRLTIPGPAARSVGGGPASDKLGSRAAYGRDSM
jgi:hypothetical protein